MKDLVNKFGWASITTGLLMMLIGSISLILNVLSNYEPTKISPFFVIMALAFIGFGIWMLKIKNKM